MEQHDQYYPPPDVDTVDNNGNENDYDAANKTITGVIGYGHDISENGDNEPAPFNNEDNDNREYSNKVDTYDEDTDEDGDDAR